MKLSLGLLAGVLFALPELALADVIVAVRTIRAQSIVMAEDLAIKPGQSPGALNHVDEIIGQEARVAIYADRPIRIGDVGPPAVVERNQIVLLIYVQNGLRIETEGRALMRVGPGEIVRVMNLSSRHTVSGLAQPDGRVFVSN